MATRGRPGQSWFGRTVHVATVVAAFAAIMFVAPQAGATTTGHGRVVDQPCLKLIDIPSIYGKTLGCVPYNTVITIKCTDAEDQVRGPYGVSRIWDRTTYKGTTGYVPDAQVYTGTKNPVAPSCLGRGKGRIQRTPCLWMRGVPSSKFASIGCIGFREVIAIECTAQGDPVDGPWGITKVWDRTTFNGKTGYVTDAWVYTGTNKPNAKPC